MGFHVIRIDFLGQFFVLDAFFLQRHVGDQHDRSDGNLVTVGHREQGGQFHLNGQNSLIAQIFDELLVIFPQAAISGINDAAARRHAHLSYGADAV